MTTFFEQHIWLSWLIVGLVVTGAIYIYYLKIRDNLRILEQHPKADVLRKKTTKRWAVVILILLVFVVLPIVSYFLTSFFSVDTVQLGGVNKNTGFFTQLMESPNDFFDNLFEYLKTHPKWAGLLIFLLGLIMLIALIINANWMLEGGAGYNIASFSKDFGRKPARILMVVPVVILMIAGILIFLTS